MSCANREGNGLTSTRRFVVEQDAIHSKHAICLAIVAGGPKAIELGKAVRRFWVERALLIMNFMFWAPVQLACASLVKRTYVNMVQLKPERVSGGEA
jgi:hypothetical protein